jgi:hypothetical protein
VVEIFEGREWAVNVVRTARWECESGIEIFEKFGKIGIALLRVGNMEQTHFLDEAILESLVGALNPSFGLHCQLHSYRRVKYKLFR